MYPNRTFSIQSITPHPQYNLSLKASPHDLALIQLDRDAEFVKGAIEPICLPESSSFPDQANHQVYVSVAGWGAKNDPHCTTGLGGPAPFHPCKVNSIFAIKECHLFEKKNILVSFCVSRSRVQLMHR